MAQLYIVQSVAHTHTHKHKTEISETIVSVACEHASCAVQVQFFVSGGHFPVYFNAFGILFKKGQFCEVRKNQKQG